MQILVIFDLSISLHFSQPNDPRIARLTFPCSYLSLTKFHSQNKKLGLVKVILILRKKVFNYPAFLDLFGLGLHYIVMARAYWCNVFAENFYSIPHLSRKSCLASYFSFKPTTPPLSASDQNTQKQVNTSQRVFLIWAHDIELSIYGACRNNGYISELPMTLHWVGMDIFWNHVTTVVNFIAIKKNCFTKLLALLPSSTVFFKMAPTQLWMANT